MLSWNLHSLTNSCELGAVRDACPKPDSLKIYMLYLNVYTGKFSKIIAYNQNFTKKYALLTHKQNLTNANSEVCMNYEFEKEMLTFLNSLNRFSVTELQELIDAFVWYTHVAITFVTF